MAVFFDLPVARTVVRLASPIVLAMLTQTGLNIVDTIMVGRLPANYSIAGQSAVGYSLILLWAFGGFLSAIGVGTQAIVARRFGEQDDGRAGQALTNSAVIALVSGTVVSLGAWAWMDRIFPLFDKNPNVIELGTDYARLRVLGVLSMVATMSFKSFFDGVGATHVHMVAAIVMNVANLLLNWVLIFGIGPFPQLYVVGAGIGSLVSTYIGLFVMVGWTFQRGYLRRFHPYRLANLSWAIVRDIVRVSVPSGLASVFVMAGFGLFLAVVGALDAELALSGLRSLSFYDDGAIGALHAMERSPLFADPALALAASRPPIFTSATKILMDIMSLSFMSMIAVGMATATLVGQSLGAKRPAMASRYGWEAVKLGVAAMTVFGLTLVAFPGWYIALFNPDPDVIAAGVPSLRLLAVASIFIAIGLILAQALFGAGMTRYVMWVEMLLHALCLVPLSYVMGFVFELGLAGIWSAAVVYTALLALAMAWKFKEGRWKEVDL